jgi:hypothetical protein
MIGQQAVDGIGYAAAALVLATFCMRSMGALRSVAAASNVAFILYGYLGSFPPVLLLHVLLLPINAYMLLQLCALRQRDGERPRPCPGGGAKAAARTRLSFTRETGTARRLW